jgi:hypothetical protein
MAELALRRASETRHERERRDVASWVWALGGALVGAALVALGTRL